MGAAIELTSLNFTEEVIQSSEPVLVDFWAEWCGPCKRLSPVLEELVTDYEGRAKIAKVNVDENQALAVEYGATSIPLLLLFKDGKVVDQQVGLVAKEALAEKIDQVL
jgi:thioredoxin 1